MATVLIERVHNVTSMIEALSASCETPLHLEIGIFDESERTEQGGFSDSITTPGDCANIASALAACTRLKSITVDGLDPILERAMPHRFFATVAHVLKQDSPPCPFEICGELDVEDAEVLAAALQQNTRLHTLKLTHIGIESNKWIVLASALAGQLALQSLTVRGIVMYDVQELLCMAFGQMTSLEELDINYGIFDSEPGRSALACSLGQCTSLRSLTVRWDMWADNDGGLALATVMQHAISVQSLVIHCPSIEPRRPSTPHDPEGSKADTIFASVLEKNSTLVSVAIYFEAAVSFQTVRAMLEVAERCVLLESLCFFWDTDIGLPRDRVDPEEMAQASSAIKQNTTLLSIRCPFLEGVCQETTERNRLPRLQARALLAVARCSCDPGYQSLTQKVFMRKVFSFFLAPHCRMIPWQLASSNAICEIRKRKRQLL
eukprot:TRINITY_DN76563_c0_g1_i1.p1 TRINITY_DN76563_c0_g1~~TRINITY_DN76563_c0_g1_i1.p1  ORF type:complete len:434 (-),score=46.99 TRINITY_DN76563_c0_g1_i1:158-1459(-)